MSATQAAWDGPAESLFPGGLLAEVAAGRMRLRLTYTEGQDLVILSAAEFAAIEARAAAAAGTGATAGEGRAGTPSPLTAREAGVLRLVAAGKTGNQIADDLGLALNTVNQHLVGARRKLGVRTSKEAAAQADSSGWLDDVQRSA